LGIDHTIPTVKENIGIVFDWSEELESFLSADSLGEVSSCV